jgi:hypothetical protein
LAPTFSGLPNDLSVARREHVTLSPVANDPDGHAVTITWLFQGTSGTGSVDVVAERRGDYPLSLTATDAYGAATTATVTVHVAR